MLLMEFDSADKISSLNNAQPMEIVTSDLGITATDDSAKKSVPVLNVSSNKYESVEIVKKFCLII